MTVIPPVRPRYNPAEVIEGAAPARAVPVAVSLAAGALVALLLGAKPLADWTGALPINGFTDQLSTWTGAWQDMMDRLHLGALFDGVQGLFRWFQNLRF
ncbi:MAG: hypothetical protein PW843_28285 [Azospirillaceae bacterium]|nr:hypothetical protein [Azospirillaceae bacterium]